MAAEAQPDRVRAEHPEMPGADQSSQMAARTAWGHRAEALARQVQRNRTGPERHHADWNCHCHGPCFHAPRHVSSSGDRARRLRRDSSGSPVPATCSGKEQAARDRRRRIRPSTHAESSTARKRQTLRAGETAGRHGSIALGKLFSVVTKETLTDPSHLDQP